MDFAQKLSDWIDDVTDLTGLKLLADPLTRPPPGSRDVALRMPGYRQTDSFSCGYVAGLMALHALYPRRSINRFYELVSPHPIMGTSNERLIQALRSSGVMVAVRNDMDFTDVQTAIYSGAPVITTIATGWPDTWHWVTLYGIGVKPQRVYIGGCGTPGFSRINAAHEMPWGEFGRIWRPKGFGIVCRKRVSSARRDGTISLAHPPSSTAHS